MSTVLLTVSCLMTANDKSTEKKTNLSEWHHDFPQVVVAEVQAAKHYAKGQIPIAQNGRCITICKFITEWKKDHSSENSKNPDEN